jgi:hypothetical protein
MPANALTVVHKFIRHELFQVSARISSAGPKDIGAVRKAVNDVTTLLHTHAEHEESGFEPVLRERNAEYAQRLLDDHHRLHALLDDINATLSSLDASTEGVVDTLLQLHLDWNRFVGGYLLHLDDEERTLFAGDDALRPPLTAMAAGAAAMGEEEGKAFLEKIRVIVAPDEWAAIMAAKAG